MTLSSCPWKETIYFRVKKVLQESPLEMVLLALSCANKILTLHETRALAMTKVVHDHKPSIKPEHSQVCPLPKKKIFWRYIV